MTKMKALSFGWLLAVSLVAAQVSAFGNEPGNGDPKPKAKKRSLREHGGSTNTGGAGEVVVNGKRIRLRDLADGAACDWIPGREFAARLDHFPRILESLERVHPALAHEVGVEVGAVAVCFANAPLKKIDTRDPETVVVQDRRSKGMLAVRWNEHIFIDRKRFDALSEEDRAYTFFHEIMHRFIPMDRVRRNESLRSIVAAVHANEAERWSRERFALVSSMNGVSVPALAVSELPLLEVLRRSRAAFSEKVEAFRGLDRCDPSVSVLSHSLRTEENLFAYRVSRFDRPDYDRCVAPVEKHSGLKNAALLCSAPSVELAIEGDRAISDFRNEDFRAWLRRHHYFRSEFSTARGLGSIKPEALTAAMRRAVEIARECDFSSIDSALQRRVSEFVERFGGRAVFAQYAEVGALAGDLADRMVSILFADESARAETKVSAFFPNQDYRSSEALVGKLVRGSSGSLAIDAENFSVVGPENWRALVARSGLTKDEIVEAHLDAGLGEYALRFALDPMANTSACAALRAYEEKDGTRKSHRKSARRVLRRDCR